MRKIQSNDVEQLISEINYLRKEMIETGLTKGLQHFETIRLSKELDKLLNHYEKLNDDCVDQNS